MNNIIGFYHEYEEYGCFSNWYQADFEYADKKYISTEQYMMYQKMAQFRAYDIADKILTETDQGKIKHLGRAKLDNFNSALWDKTKYTIVKRGIRAKFLQNPDIAEILLSTHYAVLAECSKNDDQWGIGIDINDERRFDPSNWKGTNLLGRILMEIRQELQLRKKLGLLRYKDCMDSFSPIWKMTAGEIKCMPQLYDTIHAYADYLPNDERNVFYRIPLNELESIMRTNMGGGLPAVGFWEMKQDIFETAELMELN